MALQLSNLGGYGTGALGNVGNDIYAAAVNSYARVTAIDGDKITLDTATWITGQYEKFTLGAEILFHVSSAKVANSAAYLGTYFVAQITNIDVTGKIFTLSKTVTDYLPSEEFDNYNCQVVTSANFANLTLDEGISITPLAYSATQLVGGITFIKCTGTLTLNGGHIDLVDRGIPIASAASLRPLNQQETGGLNDTDTYSAWENSQTQYQFVLNAGDGAALIVANEIEVANTASRIGNPSSAGVQFIRGNGSNNDTGGTPRQGGSTLFLVADTITNFSCGFLSKNRTNTAGAGLGRCYIASNTRLRNDEGLYAYDIISDPGRVMRVFNVKSFGDGSLGDATDLTTQLNNYALVTAISADRKTLTYSGKTTDGAAPITRGSLVMVHFNHKNSTSGVENSGRFTVAKVVNDTGTELTLDAAVHDISLDDCYCQIVSIPQYRNFTLATENSATPAWSSGIGGIFAIAVSETCDITNGKINVFGKGTYVATNTSIYYGREGLAYIGNAQMNDRLPIGQGNGSVFLLANELVLNENSRIGQSKNGANVGGRRYGTNSDSNVNSDGHSGGYVGAASNHPGSGAGNQSYFKGGYGSNGQNSKGVIREYNQGAHVLIIANTVNGFYQAAISTGGALSSNSDGNSLSADQIGGAGYGAASVVSTAGARYPQYSGNGGYNGGGGASTTGSGSRVTGGSSGWCFVYCNRVTNQNTDMTVLLG